MQYTLNIHITVFKKGLPISHCYNELKILQKIIEKSEVGRSKTSSKLGFEHEIDCFTNKSSQDVACFVPSQVFGKPLSSNNVTSILYPKTEYAYTKHEGNLDLNNIAYVAYLESVQSSLFIHESPRVILSS